MTVGGNWVKGPWHVSVFCLQLPMNLESFQNKNVSKLMQSPGKT